MLYTGSENAILKDFLSISHWETAVAVAVFYVIMIPFFVLVTKYKIKFMYRVLIGLAIGLAFGVVLQSIIGFPDALTHTEGTKPNEITVYNDEYKWLEQFNVWAELMKQIFINGILLLTVPVVFVAIFRVTSRPGGAGIGRITGKTIFILLVGVVFAFTVTFWIGYALNVGGGMHLDANSGADDNSAHTTQSIPQIVWGYVSQNIIATLAGTAIIPVIVVAAIIGRSVQFVQRKHPDQMNKMRVGVDRAWDIMMSMLMTFMKIMPMAVMSMITTAVTSRPIGALASIGKVIGVGYLGIACVFVYFTVVTLLSGIKTGQWWKISWRPLLQGFATQSSNATLPMSMEVMKDEMKISDNVVSVSAPLSTSMGLIACAGVQSGLITSFLWTGAPEIQNGFSGGLAVYFLMSLVICLVASLGIAGIPGTATVVTSGVLGGLGYSGYFQSVYAIIGALDGLFDMGRTGANVLGGVFASSLVAKWEGQIEEDSPLLSESQLRNQVFVREFINVNGKLKSEKNNFFNKNLKSKSILNSSISKLKSDPNAKEKIEQLKLDYEKEKLLLTKKHFETLTSLTIEVAQVKATAKANELDAKSKPTDEVWNKFETFKLNEENKLKEKLSKNNL
jgi:L-cystine uptake protein TcyP (sodium:dicarboxylate symporter family)